MNVQKLESRAETGEMNMGTQKETMFRRIAGGSKTAFDEFFNLYYHKLVRFATLYVDTAEQAEDIVSDVLTNMLLQRNRVFLIKNFDAYLYSSVKNKALSSIRRQQVAMAYATYITHYKTDHSFAPDAHDRLVAREFSEIVASIVEGFPPKRKMVFELIRDEELTYAEVAVLLDISVRTVEVHLRLAVRALRKAVEAYLLHDITAPAL